MNPKNEEELEPLHVHDLPQLYAHPSFAALYSTLLALATRPPTFSLNLSAPVAKSSSSSASALGLFPQHHRPITPHGIPRYLTAFISSPLSWLSESERSQIHDLASLRLAERAGRTAAPDLDRVFYVPIGDQRNDDGKWADKEDSLEGRVSSVVVAIRLHEPTLTGDNLGLKTWGAGALLAGMLYCLSNYLRSSINAALSLAVLERKEVTKRTFRVLELGAGTGILGLAVAAVFNRLLKGLHENPACQEQRGPQHRNGHEGNGGGGRVGVQVHMTDLPTIVPNLAKNVQENAEVVGGRYVGAEHHCTNRVHASASSPSSRSLFPGNGDPEPNILLSTGILDWSLSPPFVRQKSSPQASSLPTMNRTDQSNAPLHYRTSSPSIPSLGAYDLILISDPIYSPLHPSQITNTIVANLSRLSPSPSLSTPPPPPLTQQHIISKPITSAHETTKPARVISALPLRHGYASEREAWTQLMHEAGFIKAASGKLRGRDGDGEAETAGDGGAEDEDEEDKVGGIVVEWAVWKDE